MSSRVLAAVRSGVLSTACIAFLSLCCLLAAAKLRWSDDFDLTWNLFLAWIPLVLAYALAFAARSGAGRLVLPALGAVWLVFLPNAPYLVTDLVHLRGGHNAQNAATLAVLALTGLLIGIKAVQIVQGVVAQHMGERAGRRTVQIIAVLIAFGVYLGRVQRWNSWTVIEDPHTLVHAIRAAPSEPGRVLLAIAGTVAFATAFSVAYRVLAGPSPGATGLAPASARRSGI